MGLDDGAGNRQPEPCRTVAASRARSPLHEGLEDSRAVVGRDALAGVGDLDLDLALVRLGPDDDASVGRGYDGWRSAAG